MNKHRSDPSLPAQPNQAATSGENINVIDLAARRAAKKRRRVRCLTILVEEGNIDRRKTPPNEHRQQSHPASPKTDGE